MMQKHLKNGIFTQAPWTALVEEIDGNQLNTQMTTILRLLNTYLSI